MVLKQSISVEPVEVGRLHCQQCGRSTNHRKIASVFLQENPEGEWWCEESTLSIVQCAGCDHVSFLRERSREDWLDDAGKEEVFTTRYPPILPGLRPLDGLINFPLEIYRIYRETQAALASELPILAGVGIRAIVEALCKERKIKGKDLKIKIGELAKQGHVIEPSAKVLDKLRFLGNAAAHEVKEHTTDELLVAMKVIDNILDNIYTLPRAWSEGLPTDPQKS